jgi:hypothetical protein
MNELEHWQENNQQFLGAALAWLHLRLTHLARSYASDGVPASDDRPFWRRLLELPRAAAEGGEPAESTNALTVSRGAAGRPRYGREMAQAAGAMAQAEALDPPPALIILGRRFGLSRFEREVLLLCAAMELDTRIAGLCAHAQDDPSRPYPTFALALALFDDPAWDVLSPERPLRYWRLIEINQPNGQPLTTSALRADERIVNYVKGLNYLDDRLSPLLVPLDVERGETALAPSQLDAVGAIVERLDREAPAGLTPVVQLVGPDALSKQLVAGRVAATLGLHLYRLPANLLPAQASDLETLARLWQRESILLPLALYLDAYEMAEDAPSDGQSPPLQRFLARSDGLFFLNTRDVRSEVGRPSITYDVAKPTPAEQFSAWTEALDETADESPALLAGQFNLNLPTVRRVARGVLAEAPDDARDVHDQLWDACLAQTRPQLDKLAQRLNPKARWEDIVLPEEHMLLLHQIASQVGQRRRVYDDWGFRQKMNRGLGISALFSGESGTGKTMAAEVIANDLRLNLYRIDLSAVVSKYIGETEKNLRRLFDAAEDGGAILFFDEADAIFGKRSEVKDSHDRYANIEINYLLQRMEAYRGLAVLATNMKSALDQAFVRRLRFIVEFPFPGPQERKLIWQKIFPPETPTEGLDYDRLAQLNLTGGSIHNIALNAAFLAAQMGTPVTMPLVLAAGRTEFRKLERPINEADFRWQEPEA